MSVALFFLTLWALLGAVAGFVRNWIGAAVVAGLPVILVAFLYLIGLFLNSSESTDQSGLGAMLTVALVIPVAAIALTATALGWLANIAWRTLGPTSDSSTETSE